MDWFLNALGATLGFGLGAVVVIFAIILVVGFCRFVPELLSELLEAIGRLWAREMSIAVWIDESQFARVCRIERPTPAVLVEAIKHSFKLRFCKIAAKPLSSQGGV